MLYVTDDQTEALTLATRIGVLDHGDLAPGREPREIYENRRTQRSRRVSGSPRINLVPGALRSRVAGAEGAATLGVRAEHDLRLNGRSR